jgi:hypothetical protein
MILQALAEYYERRDADPDPAQRLPAFGLEDKEIPFIIELGSDGAVVQLKRKYVLDKYRIMADHCFTPGAMTWQQQSTPKRDSTTTMQRANIWNRSVGPMVRSARIAVAWVAQRA